MKTKKITSIFFQKVYFWMFLGLLISSVVAFLVAANATSLSFIFSPGIFFTLLIAELILVFSLSLAIKKISSSTATIMFLVYSFLNGLTLSVILLAYTGASIAIAFFLAAIIFGSMAVFGFFTDRDLSKMGPIFFAGLIGLIVAMIINIFVKSGPFDFIISIIGVLLFTGLTAYDNHVLKKMSTGLRKPELMKKFAIIGALKLYLDFINLFLFLLRIFGKGR